MIRETYSTWKSLTIGEKGHIITSVGIWAWLVTYLYRLVPLIDRSGKVATSLTTAQVAEITYLNTIFFTLLLLFFGHHVAINSLPNLVEKGLNRFFIEEKEVK